MHNSKNLLLLSLCIGLVVISVFYLILTSAGDGQVSISEPDQVLYLQYARNMATGQPYVFTPGDAPSSGSTTHLYIFLLSIFYRLGATGDAFIYASYALNAIFYMGIISLTWLIARRMYPKGLPVALLMTVLGAHTVSAVLKQTDIGFFMLLTLGLFAAMVYRRHLLSLLLILLCAATRPEGAIFSIAFLLTGGAGLVLNRFLIEAPGTSSQSKWYILYGIAGLAMFVATLFINHAYTGYFQFMSVANKGYFKFYPLLGAIDGTLYDIVSLIKGVFFGLQDTHRQFYFFPLVTSVLGLSGILLYDRKSKETRLCECWLIMAAGAALLLIASSQWQGISNDRYLGWMMPLWFIYVSIGLVEISERVRARYFLLLCGTMIALFQLASMAYLTSNTYSNAVRMEQQRAFAENIRKSIDPSMTIGSPVGTGITYFMPEYKVYNLWGVLSPEFFVPQDGMHLHRVIDQLKHEPELRFNYWLCTDQYLEENKWIAPFVGSKIMQDTDAAIISTEAFCLFTPNWSLLDGGNLPQLTGDKLKGLTLIDSLDIGYIRDEMDHDYAYHLRIKNMTMPLMACVDMLGEKKYGEAGRNILGSETFTVGNIQPGQPLYIVLRTGLQAKGGVIFGAHHMPINNLELTEEQALRIFVDGIEVPCPPLQADGEGFREGVIRIPAVYLEQDSAHIMIAGDHISYAYWFYQ